MPRRENRTTAKVMSGVLYTEAASFGLETSEWWVWLVREESTTFYVETNIGTFTARREPRSGGLYWYAYRKYRGKLAKFYLGKSDELTKARISEAVKQLADRVGA